MSVYSVQCTLLAVTSKLLSEIYIKQLIQAGQNVLGVGSFVRGFEFYFLAVFTLFSTVQT